MGSYRRAGLGSSFQRAQRRRTRQGKSTPLVTRFLMTGKFIGYLPGGSLTLERPRYIWEAKWWTNKVPKHNATGDWGEGRPPFSLSFLRPLLTLFQ